MTLEQTPRFTPREQEMMEIIYRAGRATAAEVLTGMADPPSYSAVRATLRVLEDKGHLTHEHDGSRYVYRALVDRDRARRSALAGLLATFFEGSAEKVVAALLENPDRELSVEELDRISRRIDDARREGR